MYKSNDISTKYSSISRNGSQRKSRFIDVLVEDENHPCNNSNSELFVVDDNKLDLEYQLDPVYIFVCALLLKNRKSSNHIMLLGIAVIPCQLWFVLSARIV